MAYATPGDLLIRYDARRLGDLVHDDGTRASPSSLLSDPNLQAALDDASGMLDSAIQRGQKYTPLDISNLLAAAGNPASPYYNSYKLLVRVCCDLAYGLLVGRRGFNSTDTRAQSPRYVEALRQLQMIEDGEWIFLTDGGHAASGVDVSQVPLTTAVPLLSSIRRVFGNLDIFPTNNYPEFSSFDREN